MGVYGTVSSLGIPSALSIFSPVAANVNLMVSGIGPIATLLVDDSGYICDTFKATVTASEDENTGESKTYSLFHALYAKGKQFLNFIHIYSLYIYVIMYVYICNQRV